MRYYIDLSGDYSFLTMGKLNPIDEHGNFADEDGDCDHYLRWEDETGYVVDL